MWGLASSGKITVPAREASTLISMARSEGTDRQTDGEMEGQSGKCRKRRTVLGGTDMAHDGRDKGVRPGETPELHVLPQGVGRGAALAKALHRLTPKPSKSQIDR